MKIKMFINYGIVFVYCITLITSSLRGSDYLNTLSNELIQEIAIHIVRTMKNKTDFSHLALVNKNFHTILQDSYLINRCSRIMMQRLHMTQDFAVLSLGISCEAWWDNYIQKIKIEKDEHLARILLFIKYGPKTLHNSKAPGRIQKALTAYQEIFERANKPQITNNRLPKQVRLIDVTFCKHLLCLYGTDDGTFSCGKIYRRLTNGELDRISKQQEKSQNLNCRGFECQKNGKLIMWYQKKIERREYKNGNYDLDESFGHEGALRLKKRFDTVRTMPDDSLQIMRQTDILTFDKDGKKVISYTRKQ